MKFLCLHGAGTSAKILESQLAPLVRELQSDTPASFVFVQGELDSPPGPGVDGIFEGPYYSFYPWPHKLDGLDSTPVEDAYDLIYEAIETEGPFDAILGFSQGATLAYSFLMQHASRHPYELPNALFKCAIFICGLSPFRMDGAEVVFEEEENKLQIPTLHVACKQDPFFQYSQALYARCARETATYLCLDYGHVIPRDRISTKTLGHTIKQVYQKAEFVS